MNWDLIIDGAARGAWNMAVDEALLQSVATSQSAIPILRFYEWEPSCLSLGRFQPWEQILAASERLRQELESPTGEFDWVRRPTGGRAVWHQHEITYSVVLRETDLPTDARSVAGAYRWLSEGFLAGLETLGVHAELAAMQNKAERDAALGRANCFDAATRCDFLVRGRKLLGAAQCRQNGAILQHGSLLIQADAAAWRAATGSPGALISLDELGVKTAHNDIRAALIHGVSLRHDVIFQRRALDNAETVLAKALQVGKYERDNWNVASRAL